MGGPGRIAVASMEEGVVEWDHNHHEFVAGPLLLATADTSKRTIVAWPEALTFCYQLLVSRLGSPGAKVPDICDPQCDYGGELVEIMKSKKPGARARLRGGRKTAPDAPDATRKRRFEENELHEHLPRFLDQFQRDEVYAVHLQILDGRRADDGTVGRLSKWIPLGSGAGSAWAHVKEKTALYRAFEFMREFVGEKPQDESVTDAKKHKCYNAINSFLSRKSHFRVINGCSYRIKYHKSKRAKAFEVLEVESKFERFDPAGLNMGVADVEPPPPTVPARQADLDSRTCSKCNTRFASWRARTNHEITCGLSAAERALRQLA